MLLAVEPVTFRPLRSFEPPARSNPSWKIDFPAIGSTVADPIRVTGIAPNSAQRKWANVTRRPYPHILIDRCPVAELSKDMLSGSRFEVSLEVPYLTEGEHLLSLAFPGDNRPGWSRRPFSFWRP